MLKQMPTLPGITHVPESKISSFLLAEINNINSTVYTASHQL